MRCIFLLKRRKINKEFLWADKFGMVIMTFVMNGYL